MNFFIGKYLNRNVYIEGREDQLHIVTLTSDNILLCDCQESNYEGIACRHELCVYVKASKPLENLNIHKRWSKEYFDITKLPEIQSNDEDEESNRSQDENQLERHQNIEEEKENYSEDVNNFSDYTFILLLININFTF